MLFSAPPVFLMYFNAAGLTTSKMISSSVHNALPAQVTKLTMNVPNTPTIFWNALYGRTMSTSSSDLKALMKSVGIWDTNPIRPVSALWNHAHARAIAFDFFMLSQTSS
jgi:hypothetical protein